MVRSRRISRIFACLAMICLLGLGRAMAAPSVVTTILPVHSLTAAIMQGVGEPVLLPGSGSPHSTTLKPSQARALARADVVFWIGEELESFLAKPLSSLDEPARAVALQEAPGVALLARREGGIWADDDEHADDDHETAYDTHIWLDPENAVAMAAEIARTLADIDPGNAERYRANEKRLNDRIASLVENLRARLAAIHDVPYIVFHDGYQYFERAFALSPAGSVTVSPEIAPGARRISEIRAEIEARNATCVFTEPQFEPRIIATLIDGTETRTGTLDPLGAGVPAGPDGYFTLMNALADSLTGCLSDGN